MKGGLLVVETHPIQYHAPVYRWLQARLGVPVHAVYGSDFSVAGYRDPEFEAVFRWDTDLLSGYEAEFLSRSERSGFRGLRQLSARSLDSVLARRRPGAALVLGYGIPFYRQAILALFRSGIPLLFRGEVSDRARQKRSGPARFLRRQTLRWFYSRCARLLYIGEEAKRHYRRLGVPEERMIFSPYCVDTEPFRCSEADRSSLRAAVRQRLGLGESDFALLFSGKLIAEKAPGLVLRAVKKFSAERRARTAVICLGSGPLLGDLQELSRAEPAVRLCVLGFRNQRELSPYYHAADLLVLPSIHEVWGLVVNEAMHHGIPCVVSEAVGCAPDLVEPGETGELFETGSADSLARALERVKAWAGGPDVRARCREKVSRYTVEAAAESIAAAYRAVVGVRR